MSLIIHTVLNQYEKYYLTTLMDYELLGSSEFPIPKFSADTIISLCESVISVLSKQESLLRIDGPVYVVGDLHGNIRDLLRVFTRCGDPSDTQYLFLGDYVDRGDFSIEVITLLFALAIKYPSNIHLLRGNHEFSDVNSHYGFKDQVEAVFPQSEVWNRVNEAFSYLSIAATIDRTIFCVHGGLSQHLDSIRSIKSLKKPMPTYPLSRSGIMLTDLMWSDPDPKVDLFGPSLRGNGSHFGVDAVRSFLTQSKCSMIIRAHQFVQEGVRPFADGKLLTVFSSSDYKEDRASYCGVLCVGQDSSVASVLLPPLEHMARASTTFHSVSLEDSLQMRKALRVPIPLNTYSRKVSSRQIPLRTSLSPSRLNIKSSTPVPLKTPTLHFNSHNPVLPLLPRVDPPIRAASSFELPDDDLPSPPSPPSRRLIRPPLPLKVASSL